MLCRTLAGCVVLCLLAACGSSSPSGDPTPAGDSGTGDVTGADAQADAPDAGDASQPDTPTPPDAASDAAADGPAAEAGHDAPSDTGADAQPGYVPGSLASCWTDATCTRVMAVAHGGAWDATSVPYNSDGAIAKAVALGCDGIKIDVRVTKDDVPVIAHSSPIEYWESLDCGGKKIEEMTASEVTGCHRAPSLTEKFQRLDSVLNAVRGKVTVQLCVKQSSDFGRTIQEIHTLAAEDFAFIECVTSDLQSIIPGLPGSDTVWYLVNVASNLAEVDTLIDVIKNPRAFMYEFDPTIDVSSLTPTRLHPAGIRSFTYDNAAVLSAAKIQSYFESGYDVVSTQSAGNAVDARKIVNASRGISPP